MGRAAPPLLPVERERETVIMMTSVQETWCVAQTIVLLGTGIWTAVRVSLKVVHFDIILTVHISAAVSVAPNKKFLVILVAAMEWQPAATEHQL